jgi:hypothetical protein
MTEVVRKNPAMPNQPAGTAAVVPAGVQHSDGAWMTVTSSPRHQGKNWTTGGLFATGLGNPPAVHVSTSKRCWFSSKPVQKPDRQSIGWPNRVPYMWTHRFRLVWLDQAVPISGSAFRVSHSWSNPDMLPIILKHSHCYVAVYSFGIVRVNNPNGLTHEPYHILKLSVNGSSTIAGSVSWVIWGCNRSNTVMNTAFAAFMANKATETVTIRSWKWV